MKVEKRKSFCLLRYCSSDIAQQTGDTEACDLIMGRRSDHLRANYRHYFGADRLRRVVDVVHEHLFGGRRPAK